MVIDTVDNQVRGAIEVGFRPSRVTVTPDGSLVYVTNEASNGNVPAVVELGMEALPTLSR
jgi:DNA-binding beta-propeller fold protein YncE